MRSPYVLLAAILLALAPAAGAQVQLTLVRDISPGPRGSGPWRLGAIGDTLLFMADSSGFAGPEVWATAGGTAWRVMSPPDSSMGQPRVIGRLGRDVFLSLGGALWRTDGVTADTVRMGTDSTRFFPPCGGRYPAAALDDRIVFAAGGACTLYAVNADSSWQVKEVGDDVGGGIAQHVFRLGNEAFVFWGFASSSGRSIWRTNGDPGSHAMALDPEPDTTARGWNAAALWEGSLYFASDRGGTGEEMWRWSGAGAPQILADIYPGAGSSAPRDPVSALGRLFFVAADPAAGRELRAWDGTSVTLPFEVTPGPGPSSDVVQTGHREAAGSLYFWLRTGAGTADTYVLHSWDGTAHRVVTTGLGSDAFHEAGHVVGAGGRAWFDGCDMAGAHGASLWSTDGTTAEVAAAGSPAVCTGARPFMAMAESDGTLLARVQDSAVGIEPFLVRYTGIVGTPDSPSAGLSLAASPNPVRGPLSVTVEVPAADLATVSLYDAVGRRVATVHEGPLPAGATRLAVSVADLSPGAYLLRAATSSGVTSMVLTVVR